MKVSPTRIKEVVLVEPDVYRDSRGFFLEWFHSRKYGEAGLPTAFVQDNHSRSSQGTLRGLHAQLRHPQGKLVRALQGEIFDVAVDARPGSPTFGQWAGERLSADNFRMLYVPPGFFHGFCVTSPFAEVEYKCTDFYDPSDEIGVPWNDPDLRIHWPLAAPLLSAKDKAHPTFKELGGKLEAYRFKDRP